MAKLPLGGASLGPPTTLSLKEADLFKNEKAIGNTFHRTRQISELEPQQSRERMQKKQSGECVGAATFSRAIKLIMFFFYVEEVVRNFPDK